MPEGLLGGCRVTDLSTLFAGPFAAMMFATTMRTSSRWAPARDDLRQWGRKKDGHPLFFRFVNRNKRLLAMDLHQLRDRRWSDS